MTYGVCLFGQERLIFFPQITQIGAEYTQNAAKSHFHKIKSPRNFAGGWSVYGWDCIINACGCSYA